MPHGGPDWGTGGEVKTIYTIEDLGELAARLGSIVTFDRRGNVLFVDSFEDMTGSWSPCTGYGETTVEISGERSRSGGFSYKLPTAAYDDDYALIERYFPYPVLSRFGFEFSFDQDSNTGKINLQVFLYTGTTRFTIGIEWSAATDTWYYFDSLGTYHALSPTMKLCRGNKLFNTAKLVIDCITKEYVRFICNNTAFDLAGLKLNELAQVTPPYMRIEIASYNEAATASITYIDDVIITQNEP